jgi:hypothetical protein
LLKLLKLLLKYFVAGITLLGQLENHFLFLCRVFWLLLIFLYVYIYIYILLHFDVIMFAGRGGYAVDKLVLMLLCLLEGAVMLLINLC